MFCSSVISSFLNYTIVKIKTALLSLATNDLKIKIQNWNHAIEPYLFYLTEPDNLGKSTFERRAEIKVLSPIAVLGCHCPFIYRFPKGKYFFINL